MIVSVDVSYQGQYAVRTQRSLTPDGQEQEEKIGNNSQEMEEHRVGCS